MNLQLVPESAPFSPEQRAWLNGFLSGVLGVVDQQQQARNGSVASPAAAAVMSPPSPGLESSTPHAEDEVFPWHDSSIAIVDRMKLAEGKPKPQRLMAAMAQLNCGSCGYLCKTYAEAIANGAEKSLTLCSPGGSETAKMLRKVVKEPEMSVATTQSQAAIADVSALGTRSNPVTAQLLASERLNSANSAKNTRHVVIDLSQSQLRYCVGDALGIYPSNCDELVNRFIAAAGLDWNATVQLNGNMTPLTAALSKRCLRSIPSDLVDAFIAQVESRPKQNGSVIVDAELVKELKEFLDSERFDQWDCVELFEAFSAIKLSPQQIVNCLSPLRPRLYSIASSQAKYADQVHLTVGRVENEVRNRNRKGVASTMFADRLEPGDSVQVFVHPSHGFTVPSDPKAPMIMVGPGTGIAPFIAFLQQREMDKALGKNWLFFGDQREDCDFLYRDQLQQWKKTGLLSRLDLAFSRDSKEKVYVQHRMRENGRELFSWLESGGFFFVCGDASRMAVDVDKTLHEIVAEHGKRSAEQAKKYVSEIAKQKRYVRDVY